MAVREVAQFGEHVLRERGRKVRTFGLELQALFQDLEETMVAHRGAGLAAPQVRIGLRACVVRADNGELLRLCNPELIEQSGRDEDWEACLSYPGYAALVPRATKIRIRALNDRGERIKLRAEGFVARCMQHEIDHLDGILYIDRATCAPVKLDELGLEDEAS